jgi:signal peptidase II
MALSWRTEKWWLLAGVGLLALDQTIKAVVVSTAPDLDLGIVRIHTVMNTGASFSIFTGMNYLLAAVALLALGLFLLFWDRIPDRRFALLALAGVVGNMLDRLVRGGVVDYLDLGWFPVFNLADALIVVCGLVFIYQLSREEEKLPSNRKAKGKKK